MRGTGTGTGHTQTPGGAHSGYIDLPENYAGLKDQFDTDRDAQYERQRIALVQKLEALIAETDDDFLNHVADMGEQRDLELVRVHNLTEYMTQFAQQDYDSRIAQIDERDKMAAKDIQQKLVSRLEMRADTLDKNPNLDISAPMTINTTPPSSSLKSASGSRSRLRRRENPSGTASGTEAAPTATNEEYRSIFSDFGDFGGVSSDYASNVTETGPTSALTRQSTNKQPKLNPLKSEEIDDDLYAMKARPR